MTASGGVFLRGAAAAAGAMAATAAVVALSEAGAKAMLVAAAFFGTVILAALLRDVVAPLLVALVFAISYNRQYFSFDESFGDYGPGGLYWTPADIVTLALAATALVQAALKGRVSCAVAPRRLAVEPAFLAMIAVMAVSAFRVDPLVVPMIETMRIVKYLLMFVLLRSLMDEDRKHTLFLGLLLVLLAQFAIGFLQFALGAGGSGLSDLSAQVGEMAHRATGTLGHPNMYAPFLLTFVPGFLALGFARMDRRLRLIAVGAGLLGCLAIVLSQSRAPVAALFGAVGGLALQLTWRRHVSVPRLLGAAVICVVAGLVVIAPFTDRIMERLTGDFGASVDFRANYNDSAVAIWQHAPLLGVGPMQFFEKLGLYNPELAEINEMIASFRQEANIKSIAPVHNVYLWLLAEIGIIGIICFGFFIASLAKLFHDAGRASSPAGLFFAGVFWGFAGLMVQQTTDFSFWFDHHMALITVLAAMAGYVRDSEVSGKDIPA
ncbi:MAG: O-antigen ligase family protein [Pseudochelatococcus sp.]|uniref:O-antigen ligase family protein n=1 Tax=Pseudochelatococcus sp. TaxID=2020869 RepID=UPI003D8A52AE